MSDIEAMGNWAEGALTALRQAGVPVDHITYPSDLSVFITLRDGRVIYRNMAGRTTGIARHDAQDSWVYVIESAAGEIKIGIAKDVRKRLRGLQNAHGSPLNLLGECAGGRALEARLHKALATYRLKGEWFSRGPWLEALLVGIEHMQSPPRGQAALRPPMCFQS